MAKLTLTNKLFIAFCALLVIFIIWKAPRERYTGQIHTEINL
jgi:hypothetical protein